jgi:hypothetical protein
MGSSNPSTTTTVNKMEIPPWLEPHMQRIAGDAGALYAEGVGPQYYPGQTWVDFNPYQIEAQRLIGETAASNDLSPRAFDTAAGIMDYGGVSRDGWSAVAPVHDIASGVNQITTGPQYQNALNAIPSDGIALHAWQPLSGLVQTSSRGIGTGGLFSGIANQAAAPTAADAYSAGVAGGQRSISTSPFSGILSQASGGNPYFQQALDDQLQRQADQINSQFSGSGRYGSGAHTGVLADRLGEARTRALASQYNQDIAHQLAAAGGLGQIEGANIDNILGAAGQMDAARQAARNQQLAAAQGATGVEAQNVGNLLNAQQFLTNTYQQGQNQTFANRMQGLLGLGNVQGTNIQNQLGAGMNLGNFYQGAQDDAFKAALATPALAASRYADWDRLLDLGGQIEARDAQMLKDAIDRFEFQNQMPWNQLGMYGQQLQGINAGGTQTQIAERPAAPLGQRVLGGAAGGAALGSIFGAPGALLGGLGGGLFGGLWG